MHNIFFVQHKVTCSGWIIFSCYSNYKMEPDVWKAHVHVLSEVMELYS